MYTFVFSDGSKLENLERLNPSTFQIKNMDPKIYWQLSDDNLAFATLYNDDDLEDILMGYTRTTYYAQNGVIQFRIAPSQAQIKEQQNKIDQTRKDRNNKNFMKIAEKEMGAKGW